MWTFARPHHYELTVKDASDSAAQASTRRGTLADLPWKHEENCRHHRRRAGRTDGSLRACNRGSQYKPIVFEASDTIGGIARTENYKGYRFDIGGHRFFTKIPEVQALWREICGDDFVKRRRLSRIYYGGKYYLYPLKAFNALSTMGPIEAIRIMLSYMKWQFRPHKASRTIWKSGSLIVLVAASICISSRPTQKKSGAFRARKLQRTGPLSASRICLWRKAVWNAISGANDTTSLIEEFEYPRLGPGMMWEKCRDLIRERGGEVRLNSTVKRILRVGNMSRPIEIVGRDGTAGPSLLLLMSSSQPWRLPISLPASNPLRPGGRAGGATAQIPRLLDRHAHSGP